MSRKLYSLLLLLATPLFLLHLLLRARRQPEYRQHWGERFGFYRELPASGRLIWIHAVSVGETRAAQTLVAELLKSYPACSILMTNTTPTGRAMSQELFGAQVQRVYLPYDYGFAVRRFLRHFQPVLGILMETEVWPNLVAEAHAANIPVVLANARLSEKSLMKAQRWSALLRPAMRQLSAILAQSTADADRLRLAGAEQVLVTGNLKFDITPPAEQMERGAIFKAAIGARPLLLAASTRDGEEQLLLEALQRALPSGHAALPSNILFVIVPRHPQRFEAVAAMIEARGLRLQRRSVAEPILEETQVLLGDSMGELFAWYAAADLAFIGGSLLPLGGQNLIEACAVGCPVLIGPHTFNFAQATDDAIASGAALRINDAQGLMDQSAVLLENFALRATMSASARRFAEAHRGATQRTLQRLAPFLE